MRMICNVSDQRQETTEDYRPVPHQERCRGLSPVQTEGGQGEICLG